MDADDRSDGSELGEYVEKVTSSVIFSGSLGGNIEKDISQNSRPVLDSINQTSGTNQQASPLLSPSLHVSDFLSFELCTSKTLYRSLRHPLMPSLTGFVK